VAEFTVEAKGSFFDAHLRSTDANVVSNFVSEVAILNDGSGH